MFTLSPSLLVLLGVAAAGLLLLGLLGRIPVRYNLRNLTVRWKTTLMTALAFTGVVSLMVLMLAFVGGMARLMDGSGQPGNVMILSDGATDEGYSNLAPSDLADLENQPGILATDSRPMVSPETYLVVNQPIPGAAPDRPQRRFLQLRGIDDPAMASRVHGLALYDGGTWFSEAGVRELPAEDGAADGVSAIEAVLGEGIAREMGHDRTPRQLATARNPQRLAPGDTFTLRDRTWIVTGVMRSEGSTFDSEVWAKRGIVGPLFGKETYSTVVARTADAASAEKLKDFFNNEYKKTRVTAYVETEYFASLSELNEQFLWAAVFVTIVMGIGGIFGVMNTMFAAISQRIADIGVMRVLGFARWQILACFLLESLLIALLGGLLGCALGSLADGWTANSVVGGGGRGKLVVFTLIVDANTLGIGLAVALLMGFVGGLLPALSAMRLRPLDALR
jgi:putative ABC transport system permease protein